MSELSLDQSRAAFAAGMAYVMDQKVRMFGSDEPLIEPGLWFALGMENIFDRIVEEAEAGGADDLTWEAMEDVKALAYALGIPGLRDMADPEWMKINGFDPVSQFPAIWKKLNDAGIITVDSLGVRVRPSRRMAKRGSGRAQDSWMSL